MNEIRQETAKQYQRLKIISFFLNFFAATTFLFLLVSLRAAHKLRDTVTANVPDFWLQVLTYATVLGFFTYLLEFPFSLWKGYFLEKRYALSTLNIRGWCIRELKKALFSLFFFLLLVETGYALVRTIGENWWIAFGTLWFMYSWVLVQIFPVFIVPLFFRYTPVEDETLVQLLKTFARSQDRDIDSVKVLNLSKETKKANAAVLGLGKKKKIVLGDTLLRHFDHEEIKVVFAHELGHDKERHVLVSLFFNAAVTFVGIYGVQKLLVRFFPFFQLTHLDDLAALPLFLSLFSVYGFVLMPIQNGFSRILEHRADIFALRTTGLKDVFISAMKKLAESNLADESPSKLTEIFFYSHPPISKRIELARKY